MVGGFFPTPYPDECLYSILCRYFARSGLPQEMVSKMLFGKVQNLKSFVYLPLKIERVDGWYPPLSGINRSIIAVNHTLYSYWAVSYPAELRAEINNTINSREPTTETIYTGSLKTRRSQAKYLRYCPLCAKEDIGLYGETYWHRQHQLSEMIYCMEHEVRLVDSSSLLSEVSFRFAPASSAVDGEHDANAPDDLERYKDKLLKIGRECEWLIAHGAEVDWSSNGYEKYCRMLRDKGLASIKGYCNDLNAMNKSFFEYWGKDFLDAMFDNIGLSHFESWHHKFGKIDVSNFTTLYHILVMCWVADSVSAFVESNPAETPFGHPPFVCENLICSHYHVDGAEMVDIVDYGEGLTAYFRCSYCGMLYKHKKATNSREQRVIVDYGHLWLDELRRCCQDPKITIQQTMEILKCGSQTLESQKLKHGLMRSMRYDTQIGAMAYYKEQVLRICQEYDEVTIALLDEKAPRAYGYLQDRDYEWIRSRVVFDNERSFRLEREALLLGRIREVIAAFDVDGYPDRLLSYGYIASLIGSTRDELRYKMSPHSELRAYLDEIVEHKATWRQERAARVCGPCSTRENLLLSRLREAVATFNAESYPDKQLSYAYLASLIGSTREELRDKGRRNRKLQAFLDEIVEHRSVWQQERAAKRLDCRSKREEQILNAIRQIMVAPPKEQISRNYIAQASGLSKDILKDNPYLSELCKNAVESREDWIVRRLTTAYRSKPVEGRPYSTFAIWRAASIDWTTYNRHRGLIEDMVNKLNLESE